MTGFFRFLALIAVAGCTIAAEAAAPDPSDPAAIVPAVVPASAFAGFRSAPEEALASWADVHRELGEADAAGMHGGHAAPPDAVPSTGTEQIPHAGHRMEGQ